MLQNYITIAIRNLRKNPVFTFINLIGLSLGMAAFILIFQYISFEKSVNAFHNNLPTIYRMLVQDKEGQVSDGVPAGLPPLGKQRLPEVTSYCRLAEGTNLGDGVIGVGNDIKTTQSFRENNFAYADGSFFQVFSFSIKEGNAVELQAPNTVAVSTTTSKKYFGKQNPIGKIITLNNQFGKTDYTVKILYEDMPENSDIRYALIFSLQTLANKANLNGNEMWASLDGLNSRWMKSYLVIPPNQDISSVEKKLSEIISKVNTENTDQIRLQPLAQQHLATSLSDNFPTTGSLGFIYLLTSISVLILIIAWFNYINLSTAASLKRAKEVGIRKISGASRNQLVKQFLGESVVMNTMAFLIALALVNMAQNSYNYFIGKNLSFEQFYQSDSWLWGLLFIVMGSLASGAYTSFSLSAFKPSHILKGIFSKSSDGIWLRKSIVVFQFSISIILIACTIILHNQLHYLENKNLGMKLNQLLVINGPEVGKDDTFKGRNAGFENELSQLGFIENYCRSYSVPIEGYNYSTPGITKQNAAPGDEKIIYAIAFIDYRFFTTYSIQLAAGNGFSETLGSQSAQSINKIIINEKAVKQLGFNSNEEALGEKILMDAKEYELIGVVKDYHHLSLRKEIDPIIFFPRNNGGFYTAKFSTQNISEHIAVLNGLFKKYFPGNPFDYYFMDDQYNQLYRSEQQYAALFSIASGLAIFIACLGLFGLATFTVEQRIKEIGIRKIVGASAIQITTLVTKDFLWLVLIAITIASPIAWYAMDKWLQDFAYRINISWWIFAVAGLTAVFIAMATVISQSLKAAFSNPVESLRSE